jgi:hypothetical protein
MQHVELPADGLDHAAIVVPHGDDVDPGERVQITLAVDVPVADAVGAGHDQRVFRPLGHLVADKDVPQKPLVGDAGFRDEVDDVRLRIAHGCVVEVEKRRSALQKAVACNRWAHPRITV